MSTIIKLNVGGAHFQTSKSTLTRFDGFFKTMLETNVPTTKDESGAIFIDRDPAHFPSILNYMRDGEIELPESSKELKNLQKEAQYYLLEGLVELCESSGKSSGAPKKRFFARNDEELAEMITNSTKKVICVYYYNPATDDVLAKTTMAMMKYGNKVDICFREKEFHSYFIHDKRANRDFSNIVLPTLDVIIRKCIPTIDEY